MVNLRRTIYLTIMSAAVFEEAVHKLLKLDIPEGKEVSLKIFGKREEKGVAFSSRVYAEFICSYRCLFFCDRSSYATWSSNVALKREPMPNSMVTSEKDFANSVECGLVVSKNVSGTTTILSIVTRPTD